MLFITAYELRNRYPDYDIYYSTPDVYDKFQEKIFKFKYLYRPVFVEAMLEQAGDVRGFNKFYNDVYIFAKNARNKNLSRCSQVKYTKKVLENTKFIVDVSGYALSSKFKNPLGSRRYLTIIEEAHRLGIPMVLMPQSFGPFEYEEDIREDLIESIKRILQYPEWIFAREEGGYGLLTEEMALNNVGVSADLVLQSRNFDIRVIADITKINTYIPEVVTSGNVAVIPNEKVLDHAVNAEEYYNVYKTIIKHLLDMGKNVYFIWQSKEDLKICRNIIAMFSDNNIFLVDEELNFWQYEKYIENFDYVVASRFHSIVHAYKHGIPCIGLGWAEKYQSLFSSCKQQDYVFDVEDTGRFDYIVKAIDAMESAYIDESNIIKKNVERIQKYNCFDILFKVMDQVLEKEA